MKYIAICGTVGAGKTTLLKCMLNLLHWRQGQTLLDGEDVGAMLKAIYILIC